MATRKPKRSSKQRRPSFFQTLISDALATALLSVLTVVCFHAAFGKGAVPEALAGFSPMTPLATFIALILAMLLILFKVSEVLGGAMFNPCDAAQAWAVGSSSLWRALLRSAAQFGGALLGAVLVQRSFPAEWSQHGPSLVAKTELDVLGGAAAEFLITYFLTVIALVSSRMDVPLLPTTALPLAATAGALLVGSRWTGPVLNPAAAFSWTYLHWDPKSADLLRHVLIFGAAPVVAAIMAKWTDLGMQHAVQQQKKKND